MGKGFNREAAEREANEIAFQFQNSNDVVGDMSRAYHADFSGIKIHTDEEAASRVQKAGTDALATGRDIFFGKGIYERNDSASKGLLAHELAHTMQQGMAGDAAMAGGEGMNAVSEYAPAGAEQGGFISWVKGLFKPKVKHMGGEKADDPASIEYMHLMKEKERELMKNKASALMPAAVASSNADWNLEKWGSQDAALRQSSAYQKFNHRNTSSEIGQVDKEYRDMVFGSAGAEYKHYMDARDMYGHNDYGNMQDMTDFNMGLKQFHVNDHVHGMSQQLYEIAFQNMMSEGGLDYIQTMMDGVQGADVFNGTGYNPLNYVMQTIMTGESARFLKSTGNDQEDSARKKVRTEAARNVMLPMLLDDKSEEERQAMPPQIQSLYAQYKDIQKQITEALAARRGAA